MTVAELSAGLYRSLRVAVERSHALSGCVAAKSYKDDGELCCLHCCNGVGIEMRVLLQHKLKSKISRKVS
jgi:hypothetical protein